MVKVSYPLKQGLKLKDIDTDGKLNVVVKVSYPLKQGLKLEIQILTTTCHII